LLPSRAKPLYEALCGTAGLFGRDINWDIKIRKNGIRQCWASVEFLCKINTQHSPEVTRNQKHQSENHGVGGSIPPLGTIHFKYLAEIPKTEMWWR
jgi:hypothetical protein